MGYPAEQIQRRRRSYPSLGSGPTPRPDEDLSRQVLPTQPVASPPPTGTTGGLIPQQADDRPEAPIAWSPDPAERRQQAMAKVQQDYKKQWEESNPFRFSGAMPKALPSSLYREGMQRADEEFAYQERSRREQLAAQKEQKDIERRRANYELRKRSATTGERLITDPDTGYLIPLTEEGTNRPLYTPKSAVLSKHPKTGLPAWESTDRYGQRQYKRPTIKDSTDPEDEYLYADLGDGESVPYIKKSEAAADKDISLARIGQGAVNRRREAIDRKAIAGLNEENLAVRRDITAAEARIQELDKVFTQNSELAAALASDPVQQQAYQSLAQQAILEKSQLEQAIKPRGELGRRAHDTGARLRLARAEAAQRAYVSQMEERARMLRADGVNPEEDENYRINAENLERMKSEAEQARQALGGGAAPQGALESNEPFALAQRGVDRVGGVSLQTIAKRYGDGRQVAPDSLLRMNQRVREIDETLNNEDTKIAPKLRQSLTEERQYLDALFKQRLARMPQDVQQRVVDATREPTGGEKTLAALANVAEGAGAGLTDIGEFAARNLNRIAPSGFGPQADAAVRADIGEFADAMRETAAEWGPAVGPEVARKLEEGFATGTLPKGVGSAVAFMAPVGALGAAGRALGLGEKALQVLATAGVATLGAAGSGNSFRREAEAALNTQLQEGKITPEQFARGVGMAEAFGAVVGTSEALPLSRFVQRMSGVPTGQVFLRQLFGLLGRNGQVAAKWLQGAGKEMLAEAFEEGGQEFGQQIAQDLYAKQTFDPNRDVGATATEQGAAGGITGALLSLVSHMLGGRGHTHAATQTKPAGPTDAAATPSRNFLTTDQPLPKETYELPPPPVDQPEQAVVPTEGGGQAATEQAQALPTPEEAASRLREELNNPESPMTAEEKAEVRRLLGVSEPEAAVQASGSDVAASPAEVEDNGPEVAGVSLDAETPSQRNERVGRQYMNLSDAATRAYSRVGDGNEGLVNQIVENSALKEWAANDGAEHLEPKNLEAEVAKVIEKIEALGAQSFPGQSLPSRISAMDPQQFREWAATAEGGITGEALRVGEQARGNPEAQAELKDGLQSAQAEYVGAQEAARGATPKERMAALNEMSAIGTKVQFFNEALVEAGKTAEAASQPEEPTNALQKQSPSGILQYPQEGARKTRRGRGRVEQGEQGNVTSEARQATSQDAGAVQPEVAQSAAVPDYVQARQRGEEEARFNGIYQRLMAAPKAGKVAVAAEYTPEQAVAALERLAAAPGYDADAKAALEAVATPPSLPVEPTPDRTPLGDLDDLMLANAGAYNQLPKDNIIRRSAEVAQRIAEKAEGPEQEHAAARVIMESAGKLAAEVRKAGGEEQAARLEAVRDAAIERLRVEQAPPPTREARLNNAGIDKTPISSMKRPALRQELREAGITEVSGKPLGEANAAQLMAAVGRLRRGESVETGIDKVIEKLKGAKIDTRGKVYDATQGIAVAAYNSAIDLAIVALKAGRTVAQAIELAVARYRARHPKATDADVAKLTSDIQRAAEPTPPEPPERKKSRLPESLKAAGAPVTSIEYDVRRQDERKQEASAIIRERGPAASEQALDDKTIPGDTRVAIGGQLINDKMLALATAKPEDVPALARDIQRITARMQPSLATEAGQQVAMFNAIAKDVRAASGLDYVRGVQRDRLDAMGGKRAEEAAGEAVKAFNDPKADFEKEIEKLKRRYSEKPVKRMLDALKGVNRVMELNRLGALTRDDLIDMAGNALGLPGVDGAKLKKLAELADAVAAAKNPAHKQEAEIKLAEQLADYRGIGRADLETSLLALNILFSMNTQAVNAGGNTFQLMIELGTAALANPKRTGDLLTGFSQGLDLGKVQAASIWQTGRSTRDFQDKTLGLSNIIERADYAKLYPSMPKPLVAALNARAKLLSKVGRFMRLMDAMAYYPAREAYARMMTAKLLESDALQGEALAKAVDTALSITPAQLESARKQATSEGFVGLQQARRTYDIVEERRLDNPDAKQAALAAERFGAETTFTNEPVGNAGIVYRAARDLAGNLKINGIPVLRPWLMFLRTPTNIFNATANWIPGVGALRATYGMKGTTKDAQGKYEKIEFNEDERNRLYLKSALSSVGMAGLIIAVAKGLLDVTASGPDDGEKRKQLRASGWLPFSVRLGKDGDYISYRDTTMLMPLALVGHVVDAMRYKKPKEDMFLGNPIGDALLSAPTIIFETSPLTGTAELLEAASGQGNIGRTLAKLPANAIIPGNRFLMELDRIMDRKLYRSDQITESVPFARRRGYVASDVLGRDVELSPTQRFVGNARADELDRTLREKGAWIPGVSGQTKMGDTTMTDQQRNEYMRQSGVRIQLRLMGMLPALQVMDKEGVQREVDRVTREERRDVLVRMRDEARVAELTR